MRRARLHAEAVRAELWGDLERLFGERGACAGCWCQYWRLPRREFEAGKGAGHRRRLKALVGAGREPGLLGYAGREPVGWIALAPRSEYPLLSRSRILAPVDDLPVWSISCLFVRRDWRRRGVSLALIRAALEQVRRRGGGVVEAYPVEPREGAGRQADAFVWTGLASSYLRAGFREVARRSETRPILRRRVRARR